MRNRDDFPKGRYPKDKKDKTSEGDDEVHLAEKILTSLTDSWACSAWHDVVIAAEYPLDSRNFAHNFFLLNL